MILDAEFIDQWTSKGHRYGECLSHPDSEFMYVYIPKNASSWTKPNLKDWGWEVYNYHTDELDKKAIVVLRDPVDRWASGIGEYLTRYHKPFVLDNQETLDLIYDKITFDDHTERQVNFLHGLDTDRCVFFKFDYTYRELFGQFVEQHIGPNRYKSYAYMHESSKYPETRQRYKDFFTEQINQDSALRTRIKQHFAADYELLENVEFYGNPSTR